MNFENDLIPLVDEIEQNIICTFHSVDVCNEILAKSRMTLKDKDTLTRNTKHLTIMLSKPWFVGYLEPEQLEKINAAIIASTPYILSDEDYLHSADM